ncbi:tetratricopeptide repeat protein [Endozoicomonas atrinae]|uniref:tetratricopeptide repeat protein n=1 Tax=Endozoicomonas atrinae TaxID=1333660 RepID=UPI00082594B9|nr:hypothetical protein [Endozoicomonas atrinae]
MITSKEVFEKRKVNLDEAYQMAMQLVSTPQPDDWDYKALAWCLIDLIKRDSVSSQRQYLAHYKQQLESISIDSRDSILTDQRKYVLSLCSPHIDTIRQAKSLSKEGKHYESADLYKSILRQGETSIEVQTSLAWELYKLTKELTASTPVNLNLAKRYINDYLQLNVEKPSLLHTCFLQLAAKLAAGEGFNIAAFVRLWNLEYLRPEDYQRHISDDGKSYPALAEKVIQQASKVAVKTNDSVRLEYILPYVDNAISRYSDNIWLTFYKAKILLTLGRQLEALSFGITITKAKANDFWAWELLGDISLTTDSDAAFSCYCKALRCSSDINFTTKVKLKLAHQLITKQHLPAAKLEMQQVMEFKEKIGQKTPAGFNEVINQSWYEGTIPAESNQSLYVANSKKAEELLHSQLPWVHVNLGEKYTVPGKENKPKRKLYLGLDTSSVPLEVSVPESKFSFDRLQPGAALKVKGEPDHNKVFQIFVIENRNTDAAWDVFSEKVGVVDHVNRSKNLIHFIVDRSCDGIIPCSEIPESFEEGDAIALKLSRYSTKQGVRHRVLSAQKTEDTPEKSVMRKFSSTVNVSGGMGFTSDDIFIPPPLITKHTIEDGDQVTGTAILGYNKKRSTWGWKAIKVCQQMAIS